MSATASNSAETRLLLRGVPWHVYQTLRDAPENDHLRMTYDRGDLEMMSPSRWHERWATLIGLLIHAWAEELEIDIQGCGSMTCRREDIERGFEPDKCYYVRHEPQVREKAELDLANDPPPDLAVEVQLSKDLVDKMELYAAFGVPELWCFDGHALEIYELGSDAQYRRRERSASFPQLPPAKIVEVLHQAGRVSDTAMVRAFRQWVRKEILRKG